MSDDNVKPLPVKFKSPPGTDGPMLKVVDLRFGDTAAIIATAGTAGAKSTRLDV
jgi:hypothetical protein